MTARTRIRFHLCCDLAFWLVDARGMKCGQTCHVHGSYRWNKPNCDHCGVEASERCLEAPVTPGEPGATCGTCSGRGAVGKVCEPCGGRGLYGSRGTSTGCGFCGCTGRLLPSGADTFPCPDCTPSPPRSPEAPKDSPAQWLARAKTSMLEDRADRSPEAKACEAWCGCTEDTWLAHHGTVMKARCVGAGQAMLYFCSQACFDAGRPLNPRAAK